MSGPSDTGALAPAVGALPLQEFQEKPNPNSPAVDMAITVCQIITGLLALAIVVYCVAVVDNYERALQLDTAVFSYVCFGLAMGGVLSSLVALAIDRNELRFKFITLTLLVSSVAIGALFAFAAGGVVAPEIPAFVGWGIYGLISILHLGY
jgi:MFS family permease